MTNSIKYANYSFGKRVNISNFNTTNVKNIDSEKHIIDFIKDNNTNNSIQYDYSNYKNTIIEPGEEVEIFIKD